MKEERLSLAQEVSTKTGLDSAAVWTAWGMSCLRAGDYQGAREKFNRILKVLYTVDLENNLWYSAALLCMYW